MPGLIINHLFLSAVEISVAKLMVVSQVLPVKISRRLQTSYISSTRWASFIFAILFLMLDVPYLTFFNWNIGSFAIQMIDYFFDAVNYYVKIDKKPTYSS